MESKRQLTPTQTLHFSGGRSVEVETALGEDKDSLGRAGHGMYTQLFPPGPSTAP